MSAYNVQLQVYLELYKRIQAVLTQPLLTSVLYVSVDCVGMQAASRSNGITLLYLKAFHYIMPDTFFN